MALALMWVDVICLGMLRSVVFRNWLGSAFLTEIVWKFVDLKAVVVQTCFPCQHSPIAGHVNYLASYGVLLQVSLEVRQCFLLITAMVLVCVPWLLAKCRSAADSIPSDDCLRPPKHQRFLSFIAVWMTSLSVFDGSSRTLTQVENDMRLKF